MRKVAYIGSAKKFHKENHTERGVIQFCLLTNGIKDKQKKHVFLAVIVFKLVNCYRV